MHEDLYLLIEDRYFSSGDFNGFPLYWWTNGIDNDIELESLKEEIKQGVLLDIIDVVSEYFCSNPHIKSFSNIPKELQIESLSIENFSMRTCLYPHSKKLELSEKIEEYKDSPYSLELAKSSGQLDFRTFDLSILELYRNDPRYSYSTDFIHGQICVEDEYFESKLMQEHDQILLKTFGFAHDENLNRYVAVFLRYLSSLSPEHQRIWATKEIRGNIKIHPDYYASSILGNWGTNLSIFEAFIQELKIINEMSNLMGKSELFRKSYVDDCPREFGFLLRPTVNEFNNFVLLLDKMLSDNINQNFFIGDINLEKEEQRKDGKVIVNRKGTIQLLKEWIDKYFSPSDRDPIDKMFHWFRQVRKLRQKPAHSINENTFNQNIFREQRDLMINVYQSLRTLRLIFANHPMVKVNPPQISERLLNGKISDY